MMQQYNAYIFNYSLQILFSKIMRFKFLCIIILYMYTQFTFHFDVFLAHHDMFFFNSSLDDFFSVSSVEMWPLALVHASCTSNKMQMMQKIAARYFLRRAFGFFYFFLFFALSSIGIFILYFFLIHAQSFSIIFAIH